MNKNFTLVIFAMLLLFSASCGFYPTMMTKAYVADTITSATGRATSIRGEHIITKNDVTVMLTPFSVNEYFQRSFYTQNVQLQYAFYFPFPLVVNLYEGMAVFKLTVQNNRETSLPFSFLSDDNLNKISYNRQTLIPWERFSSLFSEDNSIKKLPCYGQAVGLLNKRVGKYYLTSNNNASVKAIREVLSAVGQSPILLIRRFGYLSQGQNITGYIIFPEHYEAKQKDAKLDIIIDDILFSFDVKSTLQYYKSTYDKSKSRYTPYVPITSDEHDAILRQEEKMARKKRNYLP